MSKIKGNILKIGVLFMLVTALVVGMAIPAFADSPAKTANSALHTIQGTVSAISTSSFTVQIGNQAPVTINVDQNTKYYQMSMGKAQSYVNTTVAPDNRQAQKAGKAQPSKANDLKNAHIPANWRDNLGWLDTFDTSTQFSDIQVGDRVIARTTNDSNNLAKQILLVKAPVIQQVKGTIAAVSANSITITPASGTAVILNLNGNTRVTLKGLILVQNGQYAIVTYNRTTMVAQLVNVQVAAPTTTPVTTLTSIAVTPALPANLPVGSTQQFTAVGTYSNGTTANITSQVTWASSDTTKSSITSLGGLATGIAVGSTNITAALNGLTSPAVTLNVVAPVTMTAIAVTPASPDNLTIGLTQQFTAIGTYSNSTTANITSQVSWASSDTTRAAISSPGGLAIGIAAGNTNITAALNGLTSPVAILRVTAGS